MLPDIEFITIFYFYYPRSCSHMFASRPQLSSSLHCQTSVLKNDKIMLLINVNNKHYDHRLLVTIMQKPKSKTHLREKCVARRGQTLSD